MTIFKVEKNTGKDKVLQNRLVEPVFLDLIGWEALSNCKTDSKDIKASLHVSSGK